MTLGNRGVGREGEADPPCPPQATNTERVLAERRKTLLQNAAARFARFSASANVGGSSRMLGGRVEFSSGSTA
eukprot:802751-Prorocentrum_minimum.AAC.2